MCMSYVHLRKKKKKTKTICNFLSDHKILDLVFRHFPFLTPKSIPITRTILQKARLGLIGENRLKWMPTVQIV